MDWSNFFKKFTLTLYFFTLPRGEKGISTLHSFSASGVNRVHYIIQKSSELLLHLVDVIFEYAFGSIYICPASV